MISYTTGNILDSKAECLVNTVNCDGYMGKGIAYQFKLRFHENNRQYVKECKSKRLRPGTVFPFREDGKVIINFPTKDSWRNPSRESYIDEGMSVFVKSMSQLNVKSVALPPLGCGNGGLEWSSVKKIIERHIKPLSETVDFFIYEPSRSYIKPAIKEAPKMSPSALIIIDFKRNLKRFDKIRIHKTGFFMNHFLKCDYFKFTKGQFGPYSHEIELMINRIVEYQQFYNIADENELYDSIMRMICSKKTLKVIEETRDAVDRAVEFANRISSNHDLEGIATTLYLVEESQKTEGEIWEGFQKWPRSKVSRFNLSEIGPYLEILQREGLVTK